MGCGLSINISYGRWTKERLLHLPGPGRLTRFATNGSATPWQKTGTRKAPLLATNARNGAPRPFHKPQKWATRPTISLENKTHPEAYDEYHIKICATRANTKVRPITGS